MTVIISVDPSSTDTGVIGYDTEKGKLLFADAIKPKKLEKQVTELNPALTTKKRKPTQIVKMLSRSSYLNFLLTKLWVMRPDVVILEAMFASSRFGNSNVITQAAAWAGIANALVRLKPKKFVIVQPKVWMKDMNNPIHKPVDMTIDEWSSLDESKRIAAIANADFPDELTNEHLREAYVMCLWYTIYGENADNVDIDHTAIINAVDMDAIFE